jgi:hypothetical protein
LDLVIHLVRGGDLDGYPEFGVDHSGRNIWSFKLEMPPYLLQLRPLSCNHQDWPIKVMELQELMPYNQHLTRENAQNPRVPSADNDADWVMAVRIAKAHIIRATAPRQAAKQRLWI